MWKKYQQIQLVYKMVTGMVLGIVVGWYMGPDAVCLQPFGKFFLTCLKCIVLPLIIVNLTAGICSLDGPETFGRVGGKIILYYLLTSAFALAVGIVVASIVGPGIGLKLEGKYEGVVGKLPSIGATLMSLIPGNIFEALSKGRLDQVVIVTAFIGAATLLLPDEPRKRLATLFKDLSDMMGRLVYIVMILAPYGIFALVAVSIGKYGSKIFGSLAKYISSVYIAIFVMCCLYALLVLIFAKIRPGTFFRKAMPIMVTAFCTSSSTSSIPVNMECADNLGVPQDVYSFAIPLGAQINKDGTCVCLTTVFIMTAQSLGVPVDFSMMFKAILMGLILTTGSSAVPSGMLVIIPILLQSLGFPLEIVGLVAGVHAFNDMGMTMINCLGDLTGSVIVGASEKKRLAAKQQ
jgi:proton glutamate symport protein